MNFRRQTIESTSSWGQPSLCRRRCFLLLRSTAPKKSMRTVQPKALSSRWEKRKKPGSCQQICSATTRQQQLLTSHYPCFNQLLNCQLLLKRITNMDTRMQNLFQPSYMNPVTTKSNPSERPFLCKATRTTTTSSRPARQISLSSLKPVNQICSAASGQVWSRPL